MAASNKIQVGYIEAQDGAQFEVDAGTAAAPGLVFDDSAATGLYSPGSGQLAFSTSGKQTALRILADGKVGIDCSPTVALEVNGTIKASAIDAPIEGTLDDWIVHAGDTNTKIGFSANDTFQVHTGGSARIQVTDAATDITNDLIITDKIVHSGDTDTAIRFPSNDNFTVELSGDEKFRIDGGQAKFKVGTNKTVKFYAPTHNDESDLGAGIGFSRVSDGAELLSGIFGHSNTGLGIAARDHVTILTGGTSNVSDTEERVRITSDGKVGIGLTNPTDLLTISHAANSDDGISIVNTNNSQASAIAQLELSAGDNSHGRVQFECNGKYATIRHDGNGHLTFWTNGSNERLRITSAGKLGLGETSPDQILHIRHATHPYIRTTLNDATVTAGNVFGAWEFESLDISTNCAGVLGKIDCIANATFDGTSANGADIRFLTSGTNPISLTERLRIKSDGKVGIGINAPTARLHVNGLSSSDIITARAADNNGNSVINILSEGTTAASRIVFSDTAGTDGWISYGHNNRTLSFTVAGASNEKIRIHSNGTYFYGGDNVFYGGGSGTNTNGELHIRSVGTAVYQHLRFKSSDGTSQSQIMGYGGGAILFHYSDQFVWAINNQGERLNLTNTALAPRTNSTVLDLGTTGNRYRRTYTDGITVNTSNTNTKFCINGGSSANVMTIRNTTGGNGNVGILFSTQDHSGGREKAAIYHQETHGQAHYGGDFIFCLNTATGGAAQVSTSDEKFRIKRSGYVEMAGASDVRFTLGSAGTAGTNNANWVRGESGNIMYNAASANHIWETGGTKQMEISAGNLFLRSTGTRYIVLGSSGDSTSGGANNNMNWIRGNSTHVQYNTNGGFHGWEVGGSQKMIINANGTIGAPSGSNIYNGSDERLKNNIVELTDGLSKINQIEPISFTWKESWDPDSSTQYGFGAHQVKSVDETLVEPFSNEDIELDGETIDDPLRVNEKFIIPLLVKAVQELSAEVAALKSSINN